MAEEVTAAAKKERHRSPNYPAVSLKEAVERVRKLWEADGKAGAPAAIAAKHIGFGSAHGQAMSVLSALKKFGLVTEANGRIIPTQHAMEIVNLPASDPRRETAIKEAALTPAIYRELIEQYQQTGLPADETLAAELTTYKAFNPNSVEGFVKDFKETLDFAGLNAEHALESDSMQTETRREPEAALPTRPITTRTAEAGSQAGGHSASSAWTWTLSIPRNVRADLRIAGDVTKADITRLKQQIEFLEQSFDEEQE